MLWQHHCDLFFYDIGLNIGSDVGRFFNLGGYCVCLRAHFVMFVSVFKFAGLSAPSGWRTQLCSLGYGRQSHHLAGVSNPASREVNGQTFTPSGWRSVRLFPDHNPRLGWHTGLRLRHGNSRGDDKSLNIFSSRSKSAASGEARNGLKSFFIFFAGLSAPSGWRFDVNDLVWLCDTDL
jgi:hypothetical protein